MSHEKTIHDGKKTKDAVKNLKEKRAEKKEKHEELHHARKPRSHKKFLENM